MKEKSNYERPELTYEFFGFYDVLQVSGVQQVGDGPMAEPDPFLLDGVSGS